MLCIAHFFFFAQKKNTQGPFTHLTARMLSLLFFGSVYLDALSLKHLKLEMKPVWNSLSCETWSNRKNVLVSVWSFLKVDMCIASPFLLFAQLLFFFLSLQEEKQLWSHPWDAPWPLFQCLLALGRCWPLVSRVACFSTWWRSSRSWQFRYVQGLWSSSLSGSRYLMSSLSLSLSLSLSQIQEVFVSHGLGNTEEEVGVRLFIFFLFTMFQWLRTLKSGLNHFSECSVADGHCVQSWHATTLRLLGLVFQQIHSSSFVQFFFFDLGHCFLFLCFSSPARVAFGGNSKKKKNRPLELSSEVRSEPNMIVHANNNIVSKRGLPLVCFKCGSASPLPVAEEVSSKFQSAHPVCQECFAKGVRVRTREQKQMRTWLPH